jgi:hypothetical protein
MLFNPIFSQLSLTDDAENDEEWGWGDDEPQQSASKSSGFEMTSFNNFPKKDEETRSPDILMQNQKKLSTQDFMRPKTPPLQKTRLIHRTTSKESKPSPPSSSETPSDGAVPTRVQKLANLKKTPPPKPKQDDFFAEMGLSAKPTFSHARPATAPRSAPAPLSTTTASRWATTTRAARPAPSTASTSPGALSFAAGGLAADDDDLGGADDWDDDGDLDDLLDD